MTSHKKKPRCLVSSKKEGLRIWRSPDLRLPRRVPESQQRPRDRLDPLNLHYLLVSGVAENSPRKKNRRVPTRERSPVPTFTPALLRPDYLENLPWQWKDEIFLVPRVFLLWALVPFLPPSPQAIDNSIFDWFSSLPRPDAVAEKRHR